MSKEDMQFIYTYFIPLEANARGKTTPPQRFQV
jgi:hypothetical protein